VKAAIALLSDYQIQNIARRMVYGINQIAQIKFLGSLLPAHVSLKQPFTFESMGKLETWFESISHSISPFPIELDHVYYKQWDDAGIVGFHVVETPTLRGLHNQINAELKDVVLDTTAPYDGEEYRFHLTVELGRVGEANPYQQFYESLSEKQVNLSFQAETIALFYYPYEPIDAGSFICYKVLPLGS
jgi:2'-5' RNA ligase